MVARSIIYLREARLKVVKIGICGLGTVGTATFELLSSNRKIIAAHSNLNLSVTVVGTRHENPGCDLGDCRHERDIFDVINSDVDIIVELIGGITTAKDLILKALSSGKHVVTANKALIAEHGDELFEAARRHKVLVGFEATVGGGIPIIKSLSEGLAANKIEWLAGIINGTGNFILTEMRDKGRNFINVLHEAQALGYAEADPSFDVDGIDAAHKLAILASLAFGIPLEFKRIYTEGIGNIEPTDVVFAEELGYLIKHLGIARRQANGIELRVHPTLVPANCLIAQVDGVMNAVMVKGNAAGPTLYYGAGAGGGPTASAIVADLIDIAKNISLAGDSELATAFRGDNTGEFPVLGISEVQTACYLRASVLDRPGVLSEIAQIISNHGISIEAIIQKEPLEGLDHVPLIMLTNRNSEKNLRDAITQIEDLDTVAGPVIHIRVETFDE